MDLDSNGVTSRLEMHVYFATNNYLICRPVRAEIIEKHADYLSNLQYQVKGGYASLFWMLDSKRNLEDP